MKYTNSLTIILFLFPLLSLATISEYDNFKIVDNKWWIERQTMYSPKEIGGKYNASISFNLTLSNLPENNATITVAIFPSEQISKYGKVIGQTRVYCDDKGEFISDVEEDELFIFSVNKSAKIEGSFNNINSTSIYNVIIAFCDLKDQLVIEKGTLTFLNAHGYLPASRYKLLTFFGVSIFFYIILAIGFGVLMFIHRKQLLKLQYGILAIILLGVFESIAAYNYYKQVNNHGTQSIVPLVFFIGFSLFKKTFARFLLLIISMGFGVTKYTLGETKKRIWLLTGAYFVFSSILEIIDTKQSLSKVQTISTFNLLLIVIPVSIVDTIFLYWTFVSLIRTMQQLTLRRQVVKIKLYKKFIIGLAVAALVSFVIILYQMISNLTRYQENTWQNQWVVIALWNMIFFSLLAYFSFLWRPTKNNTRYGYAEVYADDDDENFDDENQVQLESIHVSTEERKSENEREKNIVSNNQNIGSFERRLGQFSIDDQEYEDQIRKME